MMKMGCQRIFFLALLTLTSGKSLVPNVPFASSRAVGSAAFGRHQKAIITVSSPRGGSTVQQEQEEEERLQRVATSATTPTVYDAGEIVADDPSEVSR